MKLPLAGGRRFRLRGRPAGPCESLSAPAACRLPLVGARGEAYEPALAEGREVGTGEVLARTAGDFPLALLSPLTGRLAEIVPNRPKGKRLEPGYLALAAAGTERWVPVAGGGVRPQALDEKSARALLAAAGLWSALRPLPAVAGCAAAGAPVQAVVVSATSSEPFLPEPDALLAGQEAEFQEGLQVLQRAAGPAAALLVVAEEGGAAARLAEAAPGARLVAAAARYPAENEALLHRLLRQAAGLPRDWRGWLVDVQDVLAAAAAAVRGWPAVERTIALGGEGYARPGLVRARLGTPWSKVVEGRLAAGEVRLVRGGLLSGEALADREAGIRPGDRALGALAEGRRRRFLGFLDPAPAHDAYARLTLGALLPQAEKTADTALHGERRPCLNCGFCEEVCPARIMPQLLHRLAFSNDLEEAEGMGLGLCVECGLCAYVCPSKIEILADIRRLKARLARELSA